MVLLFDSKSMPLLLEVQNPVKLVFNMKIARGFELQGGDRQKAIDTKHQLRYLVNCRF